MKKPLQKNKDGLKVFSMSQNESKCCSGHGSSENHGHSESKCCSGHGHSEDHGHSESKCCSGHSHSETNNNKHNHKHVHKFIGGRCSCGLKKEDFSIEVQGNTAMETECGCHEDCCNSSSTKEDDDGDSSRIELVGSNVIEYQLKGLNCASCASKIERQVANLSTVKNAVLNFNLLTLKVDIKKDEISTDREIKKIVRLLEPDVEVLKNGEEKNKTNDKNSWFNPLIGRVISSAILVILGLLFKNNSWSWLVFIGAYFLVGADIIWRAVQNIRRKELFDENFLMSIATFAAIYVGEYPEAVMVMLLYQVGEYFQGKAVESSRKSIVDLMDIRPEYANLEIKNKIEKVNPESVRVGDIIVVKPGEKVPLDGIVISGQAYFDTKAITGESVPRELKKNSEITSGYINLDGVVKIKVTKSFSESAVSKILDLVQNASSKKAKTELRITKFAKYYTPIVVFIALGIAFIPSLLFKGADFQDWLIRGATFLVVSCPCALVISVPMSYFAGLGTASKKGVLIKGGNYLEALSQVNKIIFDKTGTLTKGNFKVDKIIVNKDKYEAKDILKYTAFLESYSTHPIAQSIVSEYNNEIDQNKITNYKEIRGNGVLGEIDSKKIIIGNKNFLASNDIKVQEVNELGTIVYVAIDGLWVGSLIIKDQIKETAKDTIDKLKELKLKHIVMLTGDRKVAADETAKLLDINEYKYELLPGDKVLEVEKYIENSEKGSLIFVGDGINDAPVLARADVGIAMGGVGSDAAIEAADVVLMNDDPYKIIDSIKIAKYTKKIVNENIIIALGLKLVIMIFALFGLAPMWLAIFGDVGVSIIAVFNAMRILKIK